MINNCSFVGMDKSKIVFKLFVCVFIIFGFVNNVCGACIWADNTGMPTSCANSDVAACVADASSRIGDVTINLPACSTTWSSPLTINMSNGFTKVTSLNILGSGTIPSFGSAEMTSIKGSGLSSAIVITGTADKKFRIANIKFTGAFTGYDGVIYVKGTSKPSTGGGFRIDHNNFNTTRAAGSPRGIRIYGYTYGVIDHNNYYIGHQANTVWEGVKAQANQSWNRAISVGTEDAVYFEDNVATKSNSDVNTMFCDGENGGRIVVRYNDITNYYLGGHDATTSDRGIVQYEAYNNTVRLVDVQAYSADAGFFLRGGTHIIYNNTILETRNGARSTNGMWSGTTAIVLQNDRSMEKYQHISPWGDRCGSSTKKICLGTKTAAISCSSDADCGGEAGSCQNLDGNEDGSGYPCRDQIGVAPNGTIRGQLTKYPSLFWNNTYNGNPTNPVVRDDFNNKTHIQNNRDFCYHATTKPLNCSGINSTYKPFPYPHPLITDSPMPPSPDISAPKGFKLVK